MHEIIFLLNHLGYKAYYVFGRVGIWPSQNTKLMFNQALHLTDRGSAQETHKNKEMGGGHLKLNKLHFCNVIFTVTN